MPFDFTVSAEIPAAPDAVYEAWLDSDGHSQMTGSPAHASAEVGGRFDAWNGYISGRNLELEPGRRIVQSWRTTQFGEDDPDSQIEVTFEAIDGGTRVTLVHTHVPDGHDGYRTGWHSHYFEPMQKHFGGEGG